MLLSYTEYHRWYIQYILGIVPQHSTTDGCGEQMTASIFKENLTIYAWNSLHCLLFCGKVHVKGKLTMYVHS